jgi:positive regulator of sigma E activity
MIFITEWKKASLIYLVTFILLLVLRNSLQGNIFFLSKWNAIVFLSRIIIGFIAALYIRYLLIGEILFEVILHFLFKNHSWVTLEWGVLGLLVGYTFFIAHKKDEKHVKNIPEDVVFSLYGDIQSPKKENPWKPIIP